MFMFYAYVLVYTYRILYSVVYTYACAAPEVILNQGHDVAVDYWTIGIFITEMVSTLPLPSYSFLTSPPICSNNDHNSDPFHHLLLTTCAIGDRLDPFYR